MNQIMYAFLASAVWVSLSSCGQAPSFVESGSGNSSQRVQSGGGGSKNSEDDVVVNGGSGSGADASSIAPGAGGGSSSSTTDGGTIAGGGGGGTQGGGTNTVPTGPGGGNSTNSVPVPPAVIGTTTIVNTPQNPVPPYDPTAIIPKGCSISNIKFIDNSAGGAMCPANSAAYAADDARTTSLACCPLPSGDILSAAAPVNRGVQCGSNEVAVGVSTSGLVCAPINTARYSLTAQATSCYWGGGSLRISRIESLRCSHTDGQCSGRSIWQ